MNLTEYARILVRRGWIMLLLAVITAGSAYFLSRQQTPVYRATQLVLIQPSRSDFGLTEASRLLLNPLVVYLRSSILAQEIIDELRLDMTPGQLIGNVTIASDTLRLVIQIDYDSTDPAVAESIAQAWGQKLVDYRDEQNQRVASSDRVEARMPDFPTTSQQAPKPRLLAIAGGLLGLLVGGVMVFVLEYLEALIIRRREDVENLLNIPVLATIPHNEN